MRDDWDMREGSINLIELVFMGMIITALIGFTIILSVGFLFFLDYLFLGNVIHWRFEVAWGLTILLYGVLFFKWSSNPTDWLPIKLGHKIQWDFNTALSTRPIVNADARALAQNNEITKWLKENISPFMYARENYNIYYFLRRSDYIAFKLRWT